MDHPDDRIYRHTPKPLAHQWGEWRFLMSGPALKHVRENYVVDLDMTTHAQVLDWIFHLRAKGESYDILGFLSGIEAVLHPRRHMCTAGQTIAFDAKVLAKNYAARLRQQAGNLP